MHTCPAEHAALPGGALCIAGAGKEPGKEKQKS